MRVPLIAGLDHHMGGEVLVAWGQCPGVDIMYERYAFDFLQRTAEAVHVQSTRYALQDNVEYLYGKPDGGYQDKRRNENTKDGIDDIPAVKEGDRAGNDDGNGTKEVCHNVPEGAFTLMLCRDER